MFKITDETREAIVTILRDRFNLTQTDDEINTVIEEVIDTVKRQFGMQEKQMSVLVPEIPKEVVDELVATMKDKLPVQIDDAVINDIIETHIRIVRDYFQKNVNVY